MMAFASQLLEQLRSSPMGVCGFDGVSGRGRQGQRCPCHTGFPAGALEARREVPEWNQ